MKNFFFALRYLTKMRGSNLTRVISLSLGLAVSLLLFSYSHYKLTSDRCFRDGERIWQMWAQSEKFGLGSKLNAPIAPALAEELPLLEAATRLYNFSAPVVRGDHSYQLSMLFADTMFFDVMGFDVLRGDPKEILLHAEQAMISESTAKSIFGDKDPLGQQVLFKGLDPVTVMGVYRDFPANQHLGKVEMIRSFEQAKKTMYTGWEGGDSFSIYLKLRPGVTIAQIEEQIPAFCERHDLAEIMKDWGESYLFFPIADASRVDRPTVLVSWILMALAALTLFVAAMNYVLVSVSTLITRSRTIAMLKVGGARRRDIFAVFCWETALLTTVSVLVAVFVIWGLQDQVQQVIQTPVGELFALDRIWVPLSVLVVAFALAALIPAQLFTSVPVTLAFRGAAVNRRRWKHVLLFTEVLCVTIVTVLLTVIYLQFDRLRNGDFGFDHDRIVYTQVLTPFARLSTIGDELTSLPEVEAAGASEDMPLWGYSGQPCYDEKTGELLFSCRRTLIGENYIPTMGMQLVAGRNFTPSSSSEEAIVNQTYVRMRGWTPEEALDRMISDTGGKGEMQYRIVGVVKDYRTVVVDGTVDPIVIHPFNYYLSWKIHPEESKIRYYLIMRLREVSPEALAAVARKIKEYPSENNYELIVYDNKLENMLSEIRSYRNIVLTVCIIILLIALTGLVGYLGDEIRRRGKEVAIRKVNGATPGQVVGLLSRDIALLCLPAMAAGVALSWWGSDRLLSMFVERISLVWWIFAGSVVFLALVVACVTYLCTRRIALSNPVEMIKSE